MRPIAEILMPDLFQPLCPDQLVHPIDLHYVERIEAISGCKLPEDYAQFLRDFPQTGLLCPREDEGFGDVVINGIESWEGAPSKLYAIGCILAQCVIETSDLMYWATNALPENKLNLIIADTDGWGRHVMRLDQERHGRIYYFDSDIAPDDEPLIAFSFTDFVNSIVEIP